MVCFNTPGDEDGKLADSKPRGLFDVLDEMGPAVAARYLDALNDPQVVNASRMIAISIINEMSEHLDTRILMLLCQLAVAIADGEETDEHIARLVTASTPYVESMAAQLKMLGEAPNMPPGDAIHFVDPSLVANAVPSTLANALPSALIREAAVAWMIVRSVELKVCDMKGEEREAALDRTAAEVKLLAIRLVRNTFRDHPMA